MMKDPFEAALEEQNLETPPESPIHADDEEIINVQPLAEADDYDGDSNLSFPPHASSSVRPSDSTPVVGSGGTGRGKEEEEEEDEEENMDVDMRRVPSGDPDKMAKMKWVMKTNVYLPILIIFDGIIKIVLLSFCCKLWILFSKILF